METQRIAVIGIVLRDNPAQAIKVQQILSQFARIIVGRMCVPDRASGINTIGVIVKASAQDISALAGKLGRLDEVYVKSAVTSIEI